MFGDDPHDLQRVIEAAPVAIVVTDDRGGVVLVNAETERLFRYSRSQLIGSEIEKLVPKRFGGGHPALRQDYSKDPKGRAMGAGRDLYGLRSDGSEVPVEIGLTPVPTPNGNFVMATIIDITERKRFEERERHLREDAERLQTLALLDELTGIGNRRAFDETIAREWARAKRTGVTIALVMSDIDHFKRFNDTYGHPTGDEVLRRVARAVRSALHRPTDLVARYGGEEFVVVLPDTDLAGAQAIAEAMRAAVENLPTLYHDKEIGSVTMSLGVVQCSPQKGLTLGKLLAAVDVALYEAKRSGRNRVVARAI